MDVQSDKTIPNKIELSQNIEIGMAFVILNILNKYYLKKNCGVWICFGI